MDTPGIASSTRPCLAGAHENRRQKDGPGHPSNYNMCGHKELHVQWKATTGDEQSVDTEQYAGHVVTSLVGCRAYSTSSGQQVTVSSGTSTTRYSALLECAGLVKRLVRGLDHVEESLVTKTSTLWWAMEWVTEGPDTPRRQAWPPQKIWFLAPSSPPRDSNVERSFSLCSFYTCRALESTKEGTPKKTCFPVRKKL